MAQLNTVMDQFRYATTIVGIGPHPDIPDDQFAQVVAVPGSRPICLLTQAAMLRDIADKFEAAHAKGVCSA